MNLAEKERIYREYLTTKINPILEPLTKQLLKQQPDDIHDFIINFVQNHKSDNKYSLNPGPISTKKESPNKSPNKTNLIVSSPTKIRSDTKKEKKPPSSSEDNSDEDEVGEFIPIEVIQSKKSNARISVSAEAYGKYSKKSVFTPKVIPKSEEQQQKIREKLFKSFMFSALGAKDQQIILDSMEERRYKAGEWVIKQGDAGDVVFYIDSGTLECYKKTDENSEPTRIKTYNPGEVFGELALLYNAPRAASVKAVTQCTLFDIDRNTFNHIVKDSMIKRREKFEAILAKVDLLSTMDQYERAKIADVVIPVQYRKGDYVIRQGEEGDKFYFVENGTAVATQTKGGKEEVVYNYGAGDYFGEIALLKGEARAASVQAKSDLSLLAIDRETFERLLGHLGDLLKRNTQKYEKFV